MLKIGQFSNCLFPFLVNHWMKTIKNFLCSFVFALIMASKSSKSSKSAKSAKFSSKQFSMGWIFGEGIESFDPNFRPSEEEVVKLWITIHDRTRTKYQMPLGQSDDIIMVVVNALAKNWHPAAIKPQDIVFGMVKDLLIEAQKITKTTKSTKDPKKKMKWIEEKRSLFRKVFDISIDVNMTEVPKEPEVHEAMDEVKFSIFTELN